METPFREIFKNMSIMGLVLSHLLVFSFKITHSIEEIHFWCETHLEFEHLSRQVSEHREVPSRYSVLGDFHENFGTHEHEDCLFSFPESSKQISDKTHVSHKLCFDRSKRVAPEFFYLISSILSYAPKTSPPSLYS